MDNYLFYNNTQTKLFKNQTTSKELQRTQTLKLYSSTIQLQGHKAELYSGRFSTHGLFFATAGIDKDINIWETFDQKCKNSLRLKGHTNAVMDLCFNEDDNILFSASADKSVAIWDIYKGERIKKLKHNNIVNSVDYKNNILVTAGEDSKISVFDVRTKKEVFNYLHKYQITKAVINNSCDLIYFCGIDCLIHCLSIKSNKIEFSLVGHKDIITGLSLSNNENWILSNGFDANVVIWDVRCFVEESRVRKVIPCTGNNLEKNLIRNCWSSDDSLISCGSTDNNVYIWNSYSGEIVSILPGHDATVNDVSFCKLSNIIGSVSSDHTSIIGEF